MDPIKTETTTHHFGAPSDWDAEENGMCKTLPVTAAHGCLFSYWQPTDEEISDIVAGKPVRLGVRGYSHPVVSLDTLH